MLLDSHRQRYPNLVYSDHTSLLQISSPEYRRTVRESSSSPQLYEFTATPNVSSVKPASTVLHDTTVTTNNVYDCASRGVRHEHFLALHKYTLCILLWLGVIKALRHGITPLAPGEIGSIELILDDSAYGPIYNTAVVISWCSLSLITLIWSTVFSWWAPTTLGLDSPSDFLNIGAAKFSNEQLNWFHLFTFILLARYLYRLAGVFLYLDSPSSDDTVELNVSNSRAAWRLRALLLASIAFTQAFGAHALANFEHYGVARLTPMDYYLFVVPLLVNLGVACGSALHCEIEKYSSRKLAAKPFDMEIAAATVHEKT